MITYKLYSADCRSILPVGSEFDAILTRRDNHVERRRVTKQTSRMMVTTVIGGPRDGQECECIWSDVEADVDEDGVIIMSAGWCGVFMRIDNVNRAICVVA